MTRPPRDISMAAVVSFMGREYRWYENDPIYGGTEFLRVILERDLSLMRYAVIPQHLADGVRLDKPV